MTAPIILASASLARKAILSGAGIDVRVIKSCVDEDPVKKAMRAEKISAGDQAMNLAKIKAKKVSDSNPGLVIGADQILELGNDVFDKPVDLATAIDHLRKLSGRTHTLATAVSIAENGVIVWRHISCPRLTMRPLTDAFIKNYVERCGSNLLSTVGAYRLEDMGIQLFSRIEGDYFSILGLPVLPLLDYLRVRGVIMQ